MKTLNERVACAIFSADFGQEEILPWSTYEDLKWTRDYQKMADRAIAVMVADLMNILDLPLGPDDPQKCPVNNKSNCCQYHSACKVAQEMEQKVLILKT